MPTAFENDFLKMLGYLDIISGRVAARWGLDRAGALRAWQIKTFDVFLRNGGAESYIGVWEKLRESADTRPAADLLLMEIGAIVHFLESILDLPYGHPGVGDDGFFGGEADVSGGHSSTGLREGLEHGVVLLESLEKIGKGWISEGAKILGQLLKEALEAMKVLAWRASPKFGSGIGRV